MNDKQRRRFRRIVLDRPVSLVVEGITFTGSLSDISLRGALVRLPDRQPAVGQAGTADIGLGDDPQFMIRMDVTVCHVNGDRVGLRTSHMDLEDAARLRRLVELNLGDEAVLQRELAELGD